MILQQDFLSVNRKKVRNILFSKKTDVYFSKMFRSLYVSIQVKIYEVQPNADAQQP